MKYKSEHKLNQIFDATLELTGKVGIAGLKMSHIAKKAKIATGTLYIYFNSKDELLNALYLKVKQVSASAIVDEITHLPLNLQLYKMWKTSLSSLVSNNLQITFLEQFVLSPYISQSNKDRDMAFTNYLNKILNEGKQENLIKDVDNDILISLIIGFLRNFASHLVYHKNGELTEKLIDDSFSLCWNAIKA